jgi:microcystin-dependent protein
MAQPFLGQISVFGYGFAPRGWQLCDGQTLPISQNPLLYKVLGTLYGGDGVRNFGLPNLNGNVALGWEPATGLGSTGGQATVTLSQQQLPPHGHALIATTAVGTKRGTDLPTGSFIGRAYNNSGKQKAYTGNYLSAQQPNAEMHPSTIGATGGQAHNNLQPYLGLKLCIAVQGIMPERP